ncbi:MAG: hypothetical protein ACJZ8J_03625 [Candidatus Pelagibacter sp.]
MEKSYSVDEILGAINELKIKNNQKKIKANKTEVIKNLETNIPKDTLKLIEEAEKLNK